MIPKVSIAFLSQDSDAELIIDSGRIVAALTGNISYPTPIPSLADVGTARNDFTIAVNALDGSLAARAGRDQKREALVIVLRSLALHVQQTCNGDLVTLLSSGHSAQREPQPVGQLPPPQNVRLRRPEMSGQLKARCDVVPKANAYQWRSTTSLAPTSWNMSDPTTAANMTLTNLVPGTIYLVQARAIGSQGPTEWSDSAMLMAV